MTAQRQFDCTIEVTGNEGAEYLKDVLDAMWITFSFPVILTSYDNCLRVSFATSKGESIAFLLSGDCTSLNLSLWNTDHINHDKILFALNVSISDYKRNFRLRRFHRGRL